MKAALDLLFMALIGASSAGCGTICNLAGGIAHPDSEPRVFGGFIKDVEIIESAVSKPSQQYLQNQGAGEGAGYAVVAIVALASVDPVLSLVADTLTLPITIPLQERRIALRQESN
ncbi:MAG TPA: YceK/YidQ family lipoprotein [Gemmataceae bacterium]|nr:YceK/YidQ family lipoprotein [Gemmataceae bacterium]